VTANGPLVIAHRGASGERPENTLVAYALAVEQRCDMIEIDLHRTRRDRGRTRRCPPGPGGRERRCTAGGAGGRETLPR
jgi:hypothetical protein